MIFQCNTGKSVWKKIWIGEIRLIVHNPFHYETVITARGTFFHMIAGKYQYGNYLRKSPDIICSLTPMVCKHKTA